MTELASARDVRARAALAIGVVVTLAVFVVGLAWAKWTPYAAKALEARQTHHWPGSNILIAGGVRPGDGPSWHAATTFFHAYLASIWPALVVALLMSASVQALVPRTWLPRLLNRRRVLSSALAGAVASTPSMMCTCCTAPVAITLRRNGVDRAASVAYWLGNPLLNPAVLVFLLFVAPWQWTLTRLLVGTAAVVGAAVAVGLLTRPHGTGPSASDTAPARDSEAPARRFVGALLRLCLILLPEYAVIVLALGALRGWLLAGTRLPHHGLLIVVLAAIVGTLIVIPTAGEIPILQSLALLGVSSGTIGALLVTLPAVSVPGAVMVARGLGWKATTTAAAAVVAAGLLGAAVLSLV
ncbi:permease [Mycobacterium saskatchewanense]|uniref:Permease n=1 Tax=Mycobacterium saskatchewanense TaxID=220927 RepID=A0AAJ3NMA9_9MYCO|nr:permease [Mycobacterium saskatchewanense]ORW68029.1 permease [Mycobacterium saskatchewanense]